MIKMIARTLAILLVAGLIAAGIYLIVEGNPNAASGDAPERNFQATGGQTPGLSDPQQPGSAPESERRKRGPGGTDTERALFYFIRNIGVIALIVLLVTGAQALLTRLTHRRAARAAPQG